MIEKARAAGVSQEQIDAAMKKQGANAMQQKQAAANQSTSSKVGGYGMRDIPQDSLDKFYRVKFRVQDSLRVDSIKKANAVYGREIFAVKNLTFAPNLNIATPKNYKLGAGDELIINIYGASEDNFTQKVSPDGRIVIPSFGPIALGGLTIEGAESKLRSALSRIYSGLNGGGTHLTLSLGNIRSIKVNMVGEVARPGTYTFLLYQLFLMRYTLQVG